MHKQQWKLLLAKIFILPKKYNELLNSFLLVAVKITKKLPIFSALANLQDAVAPICRGLHATRFTEHWRVLRGHNTYRHCLHCLLSVLKNAQMNCPLPHSPDPAIWVWFSRVFQSTASGFGNFVWSLRSSCGLEKSHLGLYKSPTPDRYPPVK